MQIPIMIIYLFIVLSYIWLFINMKQSITRLLPKYRFATDIQKSAKPLNGVGLTYYKDG